MKDELRREMRWKLKTLGEEVYLPVGIEEDCIPSGTKTMFTFLSHGQEIDTTPLIRHALAREITVASARVTGSELSFHCISSPNGPFAIGAYGIREPPANALQLFPPQDMTELHDQTLQFPLIILVPGLAFSLHGDRLGKGAGYYDRFLAAFFTTYPDKRNNVILAGVCYSFQIAEQIPVETHDIAVDCLITEKGCIVCV